MIQENANADTLVRDKHGVEIKVGDTVRFKFFEGFTRDPWGHLEEDEYINLESIIEFKYGALGFYLKGSFVSFASIYSEEFGYLYYDQFGSKGAFHMEFIGEFEVITNQPTRSKPI